MEFTRRPLELFAGKNLGKLRLLANPFGSVNSRQKGELAYGFRFLSGDPNRKAQRMFSFLRISRHI